MELRLRQDRFCFLTSLQTFFSKELIGIPLSQCLYLLNWLGAGGLHHLSQLWGKDSNEVKGEQILTSL